MTALEIEYGISVTPCDVPLVADSDKYIILKDKAAELSPLIGGIPDLATTLVNQPVLGQTAYAITFNGQTVLPDQLFQKGNGALISNLKSSTGVGFGKQTDVTPIDFTKAQLANFANVTFGLASVATGMYYMKRIDERLGAIENATSSIQQYLETDKFTQVLNDIYLLRQIMEDIDSVRSNDHLLRSNIKRVGDIRRDEGQNILFYESKLSSGLRAYKDAKNDKQRKECVDDLKRQYQYYRLTLSAYALSRLLETQLSQSFDLKYLSHQSADLQSRADNFVALHDSILHEIYEVGRERPSAIVGLHQSEFYETIGRIDALEVFNTKAKSKRKSVRDFALADARAVLGENRMRVRGMEVVSSDEDFQVLQPYLDVAESMEATYSSPMKMIVSGNDVYLEIKREAYIQDNENGMETPQP